MTRCYVVCDVLSMPIFKLNLVCMCIVCLEYHSLVQIEHLGVLINVASHRMVLLVLVISLGVTISLTSVILTDIVGIERLADAFGVNNFFAGIAAFAGPPLAGEYDALAK